MPWRRSPGCSRMSNVQQYEQRAAVSTRPRYLRVHLAQCDTRCHLMQHQTSSHLHGTHLYAQLLQQPSTPCSNQL
eukprot:scaffold195050_cov26-Tisochrysis_lutea.AAC.1